MLRKIMFFALAYSGFAPLISVAQTAYTGFALGTGATMTELADSLYIGPGTYTIDGTWEIYSANVVIEPTASFSGSGTIQFRNPGLWSGVMSPTRIDGNRLLSSIDVNVEQLNDEGLLLSELPFASDLTGTFGWTENTGNNSLYVGKDLNFGADGGHIVLGSGVQADLVFDADATVSNYRPARYVITNNSILSHVVKENYTSAFVFPVGISATGGYTPAQISNASANTVSVSVQDYAASAAPEALVDGTVDAADGMDRTWHIYAGTAGISSNVNLQHNSSTDQTGFSDIAQFVTQWGTAIPNTSGDYPVGWSGSPWQTNFPGAGAIGTLSSTGAVSGSSMRSRTYGTGLATTGSANASYFSKSSDIVHPLPLQLLSFDASGQGCDVSLKWTVAHPEKAQAYRVQHSTDGKNFTVLASLNSSDARTAYEYKHTGAVSGSHYYRLETEDIDNVKSLSPTRSVQLSCNEEYTATINIFPNPANGVLNISGLNPQVTYTVEWLSTDGKSLQRLTGEGPQLKLDLSQQVQGTYVLQIYDGVQLLKSTLVNKL